jgi:hypothetical protein
MLLFGILLVFTGLQLVTLGLLAEMQARTYHESQGKPTYHIRELLDGPDAVPDPASLSSANSAPDQALGEAPPVPVGRV